MSVWICRSVISKILINSKYYFSSNRFPYVLRRCECEGELTNCSVSCQIGTQFIGCSADPAVIDTMLERMFGATGDGLTDHLTKYSTPVSGSYYFVPAVPDMAEVFGPQEPEGS